MIEQHSSRVKVHHWLWRYACKPHTCQTVVGFTKGISLHLPYLIFDVAAYKIIVNCRTIKIQNRLKLYTHTHMLQDYIDILVCLQDNKLVIVLYVLAKSSLLFMIVSLNFVMVQFLPQGLFLAPSGKNRMENHISMKGACL